MYFGTAQVVINPIRLDILRFKETMPQTKRKWYGVPKWHLLEANRVNDCKNCDQTNGESSSLAIFHCLFKLCFGTPFLVDHRFSNL